MTKEDKIDWEEQNEILLDTIRNEERERILEKIKHIAMYHDGPNAPFYKVQDILELFK